MVLGLQRRHLLGGSQHGAEDASERTLTEVSWRSCPASARSSMLRPLPGWPSSSVSRPGLSTPLTLSSTGNSRLPGAGMGVKDCGASGGAGEGRKKGSSWSPHIPAAAQSMSSPQR